MQTTSQSIDCLVRFLSNILLLYPIFPNTLVMKYPHENRCITISLHINFYEQAPPSTYRREFRCCLL